MGRLRWAGLHDASLARLTLDADERSLELRLRGVDGQRLRLLFGEIEMVRGEGLCEAAIVNTVFVWPVLEVPAAFLDDPSAGWRPLLTNRDASAGAQAAERRRLTAKLPHGCLSTIVCSYGGDLSVLAGSLLIDEWC